MVSWLDFKLALRMLVKYPGLTLVGGLAIAFAIAVGAAGFEFLTQMVHPTLPLDHGDRIVGIRNWDAAAGRVEDQATHDFVTWREELESVENLGAFRTLQRNLIIEEGQAEPVQVAEISASAFRLARVPRCWVGPWSRPDERAGTLPVVIGYGVWQTRFEGDPDVVGRTVRLGSAQSTVVGVMPEGFAFPVSHNLWVPLRLNILEYERRQGPRIPGLRPSRFRRHARRRACRVDLHRLARGPPTFRTRTNTCGPRSCRTRSRSRTYRDGNRWGSCRSMSSW